MRELELEKTLIALSEDSSASENERNQAKRAIISLRMKNMGKVKLDTLLPLDEVVAVASIFGCAVLDSLRGTFVYGHKESVRAVEIICQVSTARGRAREVALGVLPYVETKKVTYGEPNTKVKRIRIKKNRENTDDVVLYNIISLVLNKLKDTKQ